MVGNTNSDSFAGKRVALCVSGGIAAYKAIDVLRGLQKAGCVVRVAMTRRACEFVQPLTFRALSDHHVLVDDYAADNPDPIAHITFSQSVDLIIVAPATANIIAKFANGIADDFITSTYLAAFAPVIVAPAMNTAMWEHPATLRNIARLRADGIHIIEPEHGRMACHTIGAGRLAEPDVIVQAALDVLSSQHSPSQVSSSPNPSSTMNINGFDFTGERVLITTGATREAIDPVRFISNHSSGRMGFALAQAAHARGAHVTVIAGITSVAPPAGIRLVRVASADEMHHAVMKEIERSTVFIAAAAVADYRPRERHAHKIKKNGDRSLTLHLEPTIDILASVAAHPSRPTNDLIVAGFAAETSDLIRHARTKLEKKNLDLIIANDVTREGAGFNHDTNIVTLLARDRIDAPRELPLMSKLETAHRILDEIKRLHPSHTHIEHDLGIESRL
ncbi:MAG: bifunctional phosphopantothenoylcysteine decarboxylase/phosphopantothenate--cysteine ligase CoaBC [Pyrinomonadaceae bacterium MAG19_C2-C3]|nr:bifunctional phosphopantothenoylcysteine decarboxylase/phosphopantothenate--cysteine ligase CoaBC [Pyrinomonadaceae bacterium MAG19_C2-C3]